MRVFAYEFLSACLSPGASSLRSEGWAMLAAVLHDLAACSGIEPLTLVVPTLLEATLAISSKIRVEPIAQGETPAVFRGHARSADFSLVIAPETTGVLATHCHWVEEEGGRLLGPCAEAVALTGDKLILAKWLRDKGIPTPITFPLLQPGTWNIQADFPLVVKPRHGAGSQATFVVRNEREAANFLSIAEREGWRDEMVRQPLAAGMAASVACLAGPNGIRLLPPVAQSLSADGRFRYLGGRLPLEPRLAQRACDLAHRTAYSVPGLQGFFGMDLVLGDSPEQDTVIEINPRLTTSYVGLRALAKFNLVEALLAVCQGRSTPPFYWHAGEVAFSSAGQIIWV
jgi:predicted ATP-grasp superfamily ATP-dependent carboligase